MMTDKEIALTLKLAQINHVILGEEATLCEAQATLHNMHKQRDSIKQELIKLKAYRCTQEFIEQHGNILNRELHTELRLKLLDLIYGEDKIYISTYRMVLSDMLEKIGVDYKYLPEADGNTKWHMLQINID